MPFDKASTSATANYNWMYSSKKKHIIDFLADHTATDIYELFTIDDLIKVVVKWYQKKKTDAISTESNETDNTVSEEESEVKEDSESVEIDQSS